jgi:hypothetical protein
LREHFDPVGAEVRGNPLAVQKLPRRRLAWGRRLNEQRNRDNI